MQGISELVRTATGLKLVTVNDIPMPGHFDAFPTEAVAPRKPNIKVKCTHLASCRGPDDTWHHVIFDPDSRTRKRLYAWKRSRNPRGITVDDRAGLYSRDVPMRVVNMVDDYNTIVVTTADDE